MPRNVLQQLGRAALSSTPGKTRNQAFEALTHLVTSTSPPLFASRVPAVHDTKTNLELEQLLQTIQQRSAGITTARLACQDDEDQQPSLLSDVNQTYGETPAKTIHTLLDILYPNKTKANGSFVDAGSGAGIPTLAAALSQRFRLARGIEYQAKWHRIAMNVKAAYEEQSQKFSKLDFVNGDITKPGSFIGASCVFLNCVVWDAQLCKKVSERLEKELDNESAFVITMSRRLALPSFDLVDVLSLPANGGMFTFYLNQKASNKSGRQESPSSSTMHATSDSEQIRWLRESDDGLMGKLLAMTMGVELDRRVGLPFLIAVAASEPSTRQMTQSDSMLWSLLVGSLDSKANLRSKALASMLLRAIVDHPTGRRAVNEKTDLLRLIISIIGNKNTREHPAVRANLLDVLGNLLHDSPLERFSYELDDLLVVSASTTDSPNTNKDLVDALEEVAAMRRRWDGFQREMPNQTSMNMARTD